MKIVFRLLLALSLVAGNMSAHAELAGVGPEIQNFVSKHKSNWAAYNLNQEEFKEILEDYGFHALYLKQVEKTVRAAEGAQTAEEKLAAMKAEAQLNEEAFLLVDKLFKQKSIEQMNLDLLQLLRLYVMSEESRGPLNVLLNQIEQYHFSAEQLHAMEKEATYLNQYTEGALYSFGALFVGAIACLKMNCQPLRKAIDKVFTTSGKTAGHSADTSAVVATENMTWNDLITDIEKLGVRTADTTVAAGARPVAAPTAQVLARKRLLTKLMSLKGDMNFRSFALVTGATIVGGSVNIGWNALNRAFYDADITNTYLNPGDYKSDYFDALAVARLSCRSFDLAEKTVGSAGFANTDAKKMSFARELNALYSEYAILQRIAVRYQEKVVLPAAFRADRKSGVLNMSINANGKTFVETVPCAKLRGEVGAAAGAAAAGNGGISTAPTRGHGERLEVNLGEVLYDLNQAYENLTVVDGSGVGTSAADTGASE